LKMDGLKLVTEQQLREQYLSIQRGMDEFLADLEPERFDSPAMDYMFDDDQQLMRTIYRELEARGLLSESELYTGSLDDPSDSQEEGQEGLEVTS